MRRRQEGWAGAQGRRAAAYQHEFERLRRFFGFFFAILGAAAAFFDYAATEGPPTVVDLRPLGQYWERLHPESLTSFAQFGAREFSQGFWDSAVRPILEAPAALTGLGLGILLLFWAWLSERRRRRRRLQAIRGV